MKETNSANWPVQATILGVAQDKAEELVRKVNPNLAEAVDETVEQVMDSSALADIRRAVSNLALFAHFEGYSSGVASTEEENAKIKNALSKPGSNNTKNRK